MLLVHPKASPMLPSSSTGEALPDIVQKFGDVIHTVCTKTEGFYHCQYNEKAKEKLAHCLTGTRKRQQDRQVGLAPLSLVFFLAPSLK